ncbi:hypothetical protein NEICINOT_03164 [Neisseria cinerea ATCC 14685]|uniref:Uncharacterized protein n=1 Tax=Neisseria cinerea ATCC 14685 TaxID=546262 RepID=D0W0J8_NEICI|nr:hypothetical protein NEICINOT_03164 [Neisseria cinerea ATCC 14685]
MLLPFVGRSLWQPRLCRSCFSDGLSVVLQESKGHLKGFTSFQTAF